MEITQDKVLTQKLFVATAVSVCNNSIDFYQEFEQLQEMILGWELSML